MLMGNHSGLPTTGCKLSSIHNTVTSHHLKLLSCIYGTFNIMFCPVLEVHNDLFIIHPFAVCCRSLEHLSLSFSSVGFTDQPPPHS